MVWNHPNDNECNRDPWERDNNIKNPIEHSKENQEQDPPDLDDIFRRFIRKISEFTNKKNNGIKTKNKRKRYIGLMIIFFLVIWISNGFYIIKEAERGVVLRFGKFNRLVHPGLNWKPTFIDTVNAVNVESVKELSASGVMLTSDENVVRVEMNVQYRVTDPFFYLFSVINADYSLQQATDSALRGVIGKYTMDRILTEGRTVVRSDTQRVLEETIAPYNMGITLLDVNFQAARPPEEVKAAFDDAISARENEQQYIREAEAYVNEVQPRANGQAHRILEEGRAYKTRTVLEAQGEIHRFLKILPEYKAAPEITRERLYIDMMEHVLKNTYKILVNEKNGNNVFLLPVDQMMSKNNFDKKCIHHKNDNASNILTIPNITNNHNSEISKKIKDNSDKITADQRLSNIQRNNINTKRKGRD